MSTSLHKKDAPKNIRVAVVSVSTTRTLADDASGIWIKQQAKKEGHEVVLHQVVNDDIKAIHALIEELVYKVEPHAILMTGGTGVSPRDVTIEAVSPLFHKHLTAFGPLFAQLSFEEIDSAAIMSRAAAGIINNVIIFCMPGSLKACKLACNALIFPELGHLVKHVSESPLDPRTPGNHLQLT
ncbi:MAG: MogA/MoaB family molybdenum cofactor biosynthesis protein [Pseudomonadota bacterium]